MMFRGIIDWPEYDTLANINFSENSVEESSAHLSTINHLLDQASCHQLVQLRAVPHNKQNTLLPSKISYLILFYTALQQDAPATLAEQKMACTEKLHAKISTYIKGDSLNISIMSLQNIHAYYADIRDSNNVETHNTLLQTRKTLILLMRHLIDAIYKQHAESAVPPLMNVLVSLPLYQLMALMTHEQPLFQRYAKWLLEDPARFTYFTEKFMQRYYHRSERGEYVPSEKNCALYFLEMLNAMHHFKTMQHLSDPLTFENTGILLRSIFSVYDEGINYFDGHYFEIVLTHYDYFMHAYATHFSHEKEPEYFDELAHPPIKNPRYGQPRIIHHFSSLCYLPPIDLLRRWLQQDGNSSENAALKCYAIQAWINHSFRHIIQNPSDKVASLKSYLTGLYACVSYDKTHIAILLKSLSTAWFCITDPASKNLLLQKIANDQDLCHFFAHCFFQLSSTHISSRNVSQQFTLFIALLEVKSPPYFIQKIHELRVQHSAEHDIKTGVHVLNSAIAQHAKDITPVEEVILYKPPTRIEMLQLLNPLYMEPVASACTSMASECSRSSSFGNNAATLFQTAADLGKSSLNGVVHYSLHAILGQKAYPS